MTHDSELDDYTIAAIEWAAERWLLVDEQVVAEWCANPHRDPDPTEQVDYMADKYGLTDPHACGECHYGKPFPQRRGADER